MAAHVFHQLCYHFVWATKDRVPLLVDVAKECMIADVGEACVNRETTPLACNAMPDHVHLLVTLPPSACVATFIGQVKGAASHAHNRRFGSRQYLKWQDGYGVISLRTEEADKVIRYIANQEEIHAGRKTSRLLETIEQQ